MTYRRRGRQTIIWECDECGTELNSGTDDFTDARAVLKKEGWVTAKDEESGEWEHHCPQCR